MMNQSVIVSRCAGYAASSVDSSTVKLEKTTKSNLFKKT